MKDAQGREAYRNEKRKEVGNSREWESTQKWEGAQEQKL